MSAAGLVALGIVGFAVRAWIDARVRAAVQARFAREAKQFEHDLGLLAERERFDFQRRIADFGILIARRHERYAELWRLARRAHGRILDLARFEDQAFDWLDDSDLERFLKRKRIPSGRRAELAGVWRENRPSALPLINQTLESRGRHTAAQAWVTLNNYFVAEQLYFSDPVIEACKEIMKDLDELRGLLQDPESRTSATSDRLRSDVYRSLERFRDTLRSELTHGDYSASPAAE